MIISNTTKVLQVRVKQVMENLFVLPSGTLSDDPIRILSSPRMQLFYEEAKKEFDLVIYDSPPLLYVADAYLLSAQADTLIVGRLNYLKKDHLEEAIRELRGADLPIVGIVANGSTTPIQLPYRRSLSTAATFFQ
jgi:polysaccharide biosynthesis transport protein